MPAKRCPMCHQANEDRAWACRRCGYEFGQPIEKVIDLLRGQRRTAWITFWLFLVLTLGLAGWLGFGLEVLPVPMLVPILSACFATLWTVRAAHRIRITRQSLRALGAQRTELPKATVRSG